MEEQDRITKEHLKSAVANEFSVKSDEVEIINYEGSAGCATGDNFATVVRLIDFKYKINDGEEKSHSYIVKQIPFNEFRAKMIKEVKKSLTIDTYVLPYHILCIGASLMIAS